MSNEDETVVATLIITEAFHTAKAEVAATELALTRLEMDTAAARASLLQDEADLRAFHSRPFDGDLRAISDADEKAALFESKVRTYNDGLKTLERLRRELAESKAGIDAIFAPYEER